MDFNSLWSKGNPSFVKHLFQKQHGREREITSAGSLLKWLQQSGLGQAETRMHYSSLVPHTGGRSPVLGSASIPFPGTLSGSWIGSGTLGLEVVLGYGMLVLQAVA